MTSDTPPQQQKQSPTLVATSTATASEHWLPFVSLMNQSTIYRRHEARLSRTYALRDDPRPAPIRVLSGLPGFRMIVPPYQAQPQQQTCESDQPPRIGDYTEETLFSTTSVDDSKQERIAMNASSSISSSTQQQVLQAMLATIAAGGMGEYVFGVRSHPSGTPFANHNNVSPFVHANGDSSLGVYLGRQSVPEARPSARMAMAAASSTSLLFGSKVLLEQSLVEVNDDPSMTSSLLSSALAGGVVGVANMAASTIAARRAATMPLHTMAIPTTPQSMIGRHMLAVTLYFATYDGVSSLFSSTDNSSKSTAQILAAGAMAGSVQAAVLSRGLSAAVRAAPIHAMVFYAYESMKEGMGRQ